MVQVAKVNFQISLKWNPVVSLTPRHFPQKFREFFVCQHWLAMVSSAISFTYRRLLNQPNFEMLALILWTVVSSQFLTFTELTFEILSNFVFAISSNLIAIFRPGYTFVINFIWSNFQLVSQILADHSNNLKLSAPTNLIIFYCNSLLFANLGDLCLTSP